MKLLSRFKAWLSEGQDPTWQPSAVRQVFDGYDQDKGIQAARAARKRTATGRLIARPKPVDAPQPNVRPFKVVR
jgi:hypothetical protein